MLGAVDRSEQRIEKQITKQPKIFFEENRDTYRNEHAVRRKGRELSPLRVRFFELFEVQDHLEIILAIIQLAGKLASFQNL